MKIRHLATIALASATLAACSSGRDVSSPRSSLPSLTWQCGVTSVGYTVRVVNPGSEPIEVAGFSVSFSAGNQEAGSDTEPGSGTVNGVNSIGMSDWILPGKSLVYAVQTDSVSPSVTTCAVVQWDTPMAQQESERM